MVRTGGGRGRPGEGRGTPAFPGMELTADARRAVTVAEMFAPSESGPPVRVLVYRPRAAPRMLPLVLRMHGGGFVRFRADSFPAPDAAIARMGATVVSVDYRLAPAHPFPAAPDDCYTALLWAYDTLDIDRSTVIVTGSSAGGALAAAVSLMARDRSGPPISAQLLHVPVLDDRLVTPSMNQFNGTEDAAALWRDYLPPGTNRRRTSSYAAPAREQVLAGLPRTYIQVNGLDPLRDEGLAFALRLLGAGVPVEVYCAPGLKHGSMPGDSAAARQAQALFDMAMRRVLRRPCPFSLD